MPQHSPALLRRCPACDGFPVVHITTGTRTTDGTRTTIPATCPTCRGTGHTAPASAAALVRAGR